MDVELFMNILYCISNGATLLMCIWFAMLICWYVYELCKYRITKEFEEKTPNMDNTSE